MEISTLAGTLKNRETLAVKTYEDKKIHRLEWTIDLCDLLHYLTYF